MNRLFLSAAAAALVLTGCKAKAPDAQAGAPAVAGQPAAAAAAPKPPGFDVAVTLSPAATQRLANGETVIVWAQFYGDANAEGRKHHAGDEEDQVSFGPNAQVEIPGAGTAHIVPPPADPDKLKYVEGGKETVLINVYSGRHTSPDNLLDCGLFQDDVTVAEAKGVSVSCKLIGEGG